MDQPESERLERVFTLRLWREAGAHSAIRGSIVEVGNGRRFFFTQLTDLKDFLTLQLIE
ncbi:MAG TPA: hypothetical protein VGX91_06275 [Candidatus Cybelea sp.]|jgi:hypothetical protein|nr:hypothetical protein [Candidatus Cybelea sp.]